MFIDTRVDECTVLILICVHINISLPGKHTDPNPSMHFISRSIIRWIVSGINRDKILTVWIRNAPRRGPVPWLTKYRCFPPKPGGVCGHRRSSSSGDSAIRRWALWSCVPRSARFALEASSSQPLRPRGPINDQGERVARPVPIVPRCTMDSWIHPEFATIEKSCLRPCLVAGRESATPAPCAKLKMYQSLRSNEIA